MSTPPIKENRHRRSYSKRFKAEIVAQCLEGSDSIASLALAHGMNPNVLHHWVTQHRRYGMHDLGDLEVANIAHVVAPKNWVAVSSNVVHQKVSKSVYEPGPTKAAKAGAQGITLELTGHNGVTAKLQWQGEGHVSLAQFMKALLT